VCQKGVKEIEVLTYLRDGWKLGQENPRIWMSDILNKISKYIHKEEIEKYTKNGWIKGRKFTHHSDIKTGKFKK
jgi:hypothetical protein